MGKALIIIVLGFSVIFGGMMFNLSANRQRSANALVAQYERLIARNAVESITNVAAAKLYADPNWTTGYSNRKYGGASYSVTVTDITGDSTYQAKTLRVLTTVGYANAVDSTESIYIQPAYSYYYFFLNNWPPSLDYATGDTLVGPIHTNTRMRVRGDPVFFGKVTSADGTYQAVLGGDDPKFYGGVVFGTPVIPLPDLAPLANEGMAGGHTFDQELWLHFNADGSYDYSTDGWMTASSENIVSNNGIIMTEPGSNQNIHVEGVVNGRVTVFADRDIIIEDDITYASNPINDPNSDDFLGLVARHRVTIPNNAANSFDVVIHAAIIAHHDEINVPNWDTGGPWGTLTILGSIVENDFQPYGTATTGYAINHVYDVRLRDQTPPFFPRVPSRIELIYRSN